MDGSSKFKNGVGGAWLKLKENEEMWQNKKNRGQI